MPTCERNSGIVADAAHDQVIANQQGIFHGARRNYARLPNRSINQQKRQADPKPRDNLALNFCAHWHVRHFLFLVALSLHFPPPPAFLLRVHQRNSHSGHRPHRCRTRLYRRGPPVARDPSGKRRCNRKCKTSLPCHRPPGVSLPERCNRENRRQEICESVPVNWKKRSTPRASACPRRNSRAKSWEDN